MCRIFTNSGFNSRWPFAEHYKGVTPTVSMPRSCFIRDITFVYSVRIHAIVLANYCHFVAAFSKPRSSVIIRLPACLPSPLWDNHVTCLRTIYQSVQYIHRSYCCAVFNLTLIWSNCSPSALCIGTTYIHLIVKSSVFYFLLSLLE